MFFAINKHVTMERDAEKLFSELKIFWPLANYCPEIQKETNIFDLFEFSVCCKFHT